MTEKEFQQYGNQKAVTTKLNPPMLLCVSNSGLQNGAGA